MRDNEVVQDSGKRVENLDATDLRLLKCMHKAVTIGSLRETAGLEESDFARRLRRLVRFGIVVQGVQQSEATKKLIRRLELQERAVASRDYFKVLGLRSGASDAQLKKAFLMLSKIYHPDRASAEVKANDTLMDRLEHAYHDIQQAYDTLRDPARRKEWARKQLEQRRGQRIGETQEEEQDGTQASTPKVEGAVRLATLLPLIGQSIDNGEFRSARNNLQLARMIDGSDERVMRLATELDVMSKLRKIVEGLERTDYLSDAESARIEAALRKHIKVVMAHRKFMGRLFRVCVERSLADELVAELFHTLASGTMSAEEYVAGVQFFQRRNLLATAKETLEVAQRQYPADAELKKLAKQLKRSR